jgi:hypothetical protein
MITSFSYITNVKEKTPVPSPAFFFLVTNSQKSMSKVESAKMKCFFDIFNSHIMTKNLREIAIFLYTVQEDSQKKGEKTRILKNNYFHI